MNVIDLTDDATDGRQEEKLPPVGADISADVVDVDDEFGEDDGDGDSHIIVLDADDEEDDEETLRPAKFPRRQNNQTPPTPQIAKTFDQIHASDVHETARRRRIVSTGSDLTTMTNHAIDRSSHRVAEPERSKSMSRNKQQKQDNTRQPTTASNVSNIPTSQSDNGTSTLTRVAKIPPQRQVHNDQYFEMPPNRQMPNPMSSNQRGTFFANKTHHRDRQAGSKTVNMNRYVREQQLLKQNVTLAYHSSGIDRAHGDSRENTNLKMLSYRNNQERAKQYHCHSREQQQEYRHRTSSGTDHWDKNGSHNKIHDKQSDFRNEWRQRHHDEDNGGSQRQFQHAVQESNKSRNTGNERCYKRPRSHLQGAQQRRSEDDRRLVDASKKHHCFVDHGRWHQEHDATNRNTGQRSEWPWKVPQAQTDSDSVIHVADKAIFNHSFRHGRQPTNPQANSDRADPSRIETKKSQGGNTLQHSISGDEGTYHARQNLEPYLQECLKTQDAPHNYDGPGNCTLHQTSIACQDEKEVRCQDEKEIRSDHDRSRQIQEGMHVGNRQLECALARPPFDTQWPRETSTAATDTISFDIARDTAKDHVEMSITEDSASTSDDASGQFTADLATLAKLDAKTSQDNSPCILSRSESSQDGIHKRQEAQPANLNDGIADFDVAEGGQTCVIAKATDYVTIDPTSIAKGSEMTSAYTFEECSRDFLKAGMVHETHASFISTETTPSTRKTVDENSDQKIGKQSDIGELDCQDERYSCSNQPQVKPLETNAPSFNENTFETIDSKGKLNEKETLRKRPVADSSKHDPIRSVDNSNSANFVDLSFEDEDSCDPTDEAKSSAELPEPRNQKKTSATNKATRRARTADDSSKSSVPLKKFCSSKGWLRKPFKSTKASKPTLQPNRHSEQGKDRDLCFRWTFYDQSASLRNSTSAGIYHFETPTRKEFNAPSFKGGEKQGNTEQRQHFKITRKTMRPDDVSDGFFKRNRDYNFTISEQDALELQEKLLREAADRVRSQTTACIEFGSECEFTEPIQDVAQIYPNHWTWSNPYARLGLPNGAPLTLIKSHYRKLALKYHPDKCSVTDAANRFQMVTGAYQTLTRSGI